MECFKGFKLKVIRVVPLKYFNTFYLEFRQSIKYLVAKWFVWSIKVITDISTLY